jgi:TRAP-type mannitol/chloroaromatic compound transport system permease small subunit
VLIDLSLSYYLVNVCVVTYFLIPCYFGIHLFNPPSRCCLESCFIIFNFQMLISKFEEIRMQEEETFDVFYSKLSGIRNSMISLGKKFLMVAGSAAIADGVEDYAAK